MKFYTFLNEESASDVERDCSAIIRLCKKYKLVLQRGVTQKADTTSLHKIEIEKRVQRTDRKPLDLAPLLHDLYDEKMFKKFGWKPRREGVFVYPVSLGEFEFLSTQSFFSNKFAVFPANGFKYVYSPNIKDLFNDVSNNREIRHYSAWEDVPVQFQDEAFAEADKYMISYTDKNFAASVDHEMMIKCKFYYLVKPRLAIDMIRGKS